MNEKIRKHTPGPWKADLENPWPAQIGCCPLVGNPYSIAHGTDNVAAASTPEDARLIAAAPELLEALTLLVAGIENSVSSTYIPLIKARTAIAKAEGR
jgi:hypothetical protein